MSDISLGEGYGVFLGVFLTVCIGGVAALLALAAAFVARLAPGEVRSLCVARFVAGPVACVGTGGLSYLMTAVLTDVMRQESPGGRTALGVLDNWWFLYPIAGVAIGAAVSVAIARRRQRALGLEGLSPPDSQAQV